MVKFLGLLLASIMFARVAAADTTLLTERCTATNICYAVPNNGGLEIDYISNATQYKRVLVSLAGDTYDSGLWATNGALNQTDLPLYNAAGNVIYVTLSYSVSVGPCQRSGRVTVCPRYVTLLTGEIKQ